MKNHTCHETGRSGQLPLVPPNKPKAQLPKNDVPKKFLSLYSTCKHSGKLAKRLSLSRD